MTEHGPRWHPLRVLGSVAVACLLLTSAVLAWLRLTDPGARRLIELTALVPGGLPAAVLALLGCAGGVVLRRERTPVAVVTTRVAACAALSLTVVHAWWLAPLYSGERPTGGAGSLVVLAQNFEYGDAAHLAELVRRRDVDVLVLTDVSTAQLHLLREAGVQRLLPHVVGVEGDAVHGGAVVLSRVPVARTAPLHEGAASRVVDVRAPGLGLLRIVAVHTRPPYAPDDWRRDHEEIHGALTRLRVDEEPAMVLAGDFNATLAHAPVRRIVELGFTDAAAQVDLGWSPTWPAGGHERRLGVAVPPFAAIDHVMTSPGLVVTDAETVAVPGADHEAVLATISRSG